MLVVCDALRLDIFLELLTRGYLPNTLKLIRRGTLFTNAYALANATDPSLTTILTGRHPLIHGIIHHDGMITMSEIRIAYSVPLLSHYLAFKGYHTIAIDFLGRWYAKGFHRYLTRDLGERERFVSTIRLLKNLILNFDLKTLNWVLKGYLKLVKVPYSKHQVADVLTEYAIGFIREALRRHRKPFFIFIHYWNTHVPYYAPPQFIDLATKIQTSVIPKEIIDIPLRHVINKITWSPLKYLLMEWFNAMNFRLVGDVIKVYYAACLYIDSQIGKLVEFLENNGLLEDTVIIVTGDHGESLGEHGIFFDHHGLYNVSLKVPIIISLPDKEKDKQYKNYKCQYLVSHVDLAPTVLSLCNVREKTILNIFDGRNILDLSVEKNIQPRTIIAIETWHSYRIAIVHGRWKLIFAPFARYARCRCCNVMHGDLIELYDLAKDPYERTNLADQDRDLVNELLKRFSQYILRFKLLCLKYSLRRL